MFLPSSLPLNINLNTQCKKHFRENQKINHLKRKVKRGADRRCVADAGTAQGAADAGFGDIKSPSKASGVGTLSHKRLELCHKVSVPF